jgi:hypothetical protein
MITWDEQWPSLRHGDVYPLPLATETNWTADGWEVNVMMRHDTSPDGYTSTPIWTYQAPYADPGRETPDEADKVTRVATQAFALRLREVLG